MKQKFIGFFGFINWVNKVNWPNEGLPLEKSALETLKGG